ncbi:hypothetical protein [Kineosporia succinea]|uniref:Mannosyl-glycoprotein endo-beta-N-acetylglucosaminidase n=1 Tax=Kineosporia succinea TaxID=84632 RepID=A0ABT9PDR7_9ACTN|nr:hypothetical protein [Kineosporia succinea]MDP9830856.1 hypothetical protein [Kineosporia succinea]
MASSRRKPVRGRPTLRRRWQALVRHRVKPVVIGGAALTAAATATLGLVLHGLIDDVPPAPRPLGATLPLDWRGLACAVDTADASDPDLVTHVFDAEQRANARIIVRTAARLDLPPRAWIIALATAIQESSLRNLDHGDVVGPDSRGLFQQRAAWGPDRARMNPAAATRLFLTGGRGGQAGLTDIPGWQDLSLSRAAQAVQRSAHPEAYASHELEATALVLENTDDPVTAASLRAACTRPA